MHLYTTSSVKHYSPIWCWVCELYNNIVDIRPVNSTFGHTNEPERSIFYMPTKLQKLWRPIIEASFLNFLMPYHFLHLLCKCMGRSLCPDPLKTCSILGYSKRNSLSLSFLPPPQKKKWKPRIPVILMYKVVKNDDFENLAPCLPPSPGGGKGKLAREARQYFLGWEKCPTDPKAATGIKI